MVGVFVSYCLGQCSTNRKVFSWSCEAAFSRTALTEFVWFLPIWGRGAAFCTRSLATSRGSLMLATCARWWQATGWDDVWVRDWVLCVPWTICGGHLQWLTGRFLMETVPWFVWSMLAYCPPRAVGAVLLGAPHSPAEQYISGFWVGLERGFSLAASCRAGGAMCSLTCSPFPPWGNHRLGGFSWWGAVSHGQGWWG